MPETNKSTTPVHTRKTILWLAAALSWILLCVLLLAYRFTLPTDGWLSVEPDGFNSNGFIYRQNVLGLPSNLRAGDQVIEIHKTPIVNGLYIALDDGSKKAWKAGGVVEYTVQREGQNLPMQVRLGRWMIDQVLAATVFANAATIFTWLGLIIFVSVSFYAFWRRPNLPATTALMFLATFLVSIFLTMNILPPMVADVLDPAANVAVVTITLLTFSVFLPPTLIRFGLTFPHPKTILRKLPWLVYLPYLVGAGVIAAFTMRVYVAGWLWVGISVLITICLLVHNAFTMRDSISRAQMRWALGGTLLGLILFGMTFINFLFVGSSAGLAGQLLSALGSLGFPIMGIGLAVATLRYQLFGLERIVNRALVYFGMTVSVIVLYVLVVGYLSYLFQAQGSLLISLTATGAVAVLFEPLRRGLQRGVNRLMYGERDEPYELLMRLGRQIETALDSSTGLALTVDALAKALKLPYVALALGEEGSMQVEAQSGTPQQRIEHFPLIFAGQCIGELRAAPRAEDEAFSPIDRQLLGNLARQISATAHAHLLGIRLEQARLRLVTERGEARRLLGRDLHDGIGHQLTGLGQKLEHAIRMTSQDPDQAEKLFREVSQQVVSLTREIRELAHRIYPPELELLGLTGALRERAQGYPSVHIDLEAPEDLPGLPAEIETAVYYITLEALTNIAKHAQAQHCQVRLRLVQTGGLELEINDSGMGLAQPLSSGMGMLSMQARAVEVGGTFTVDTLPGKGTTIRVRIPCPAKGG